MPETDDSTASFPWIPLITAIGLVSGFLLFLPQITSSRPGGGDSKLANPSFAPQSIDARLWQDPLGSAEADIEEEKKLDKLQPPTKSLDAVQSHEIEQFQRLLIDKILTGPTSANIVISTPNAPERFEVLAVLVPGGPYVEDIERRLRARRAIVEALGEKGYEPEEDHKLQYFNAPWESLAPNCRRAITAVQGARSQEDNGSPRSLEGQSLVPARAKKRLLGSNLLVPFEWYERDRFSTGQSNIVHMLVLWLNDDAFFDAPLTRLADLISWFRVFDCNNKQFLPLPQFNVLGPDNSGTLRKMVLETKENEWNDSTRDCLATTHIYSSQAAAADDKLLLGLSTPHSTCTSLIESEVNRPAFRFVRTLAPDDKVVQTLWQELAMRGVIAADHVAIISEQDTYYARALSSTFTDVDGKHPDFVVDSYKYLRGIDGELPSNELEKQDTPISPPSDNSRQSSTRPSEQTEGLNQADDIRRLAKMLQNKDKDLRDLHGNASLKAIGLLGSDVYDKLELLKALRPALPNAIFFTNNLDARLAHPDEWMETHNLIVVSPFDLSPNTGQTVPPFRDSAQTALYSATLEALDNATPEPVPPFVFEVDRDGFKDLKSQEGIGATIVFVLLRLSVFTSLAICLVAWIAWVSSIIGEDDNSNIGEHDAS
jgi:hypothetical protein